MKTKPTVFSASDFLRHGEVFGSQHPPAQLGIFGDPVVQSASPPMHNAALRESGRALQYVRILVKSGELESSLRSLAPAGFLGVNLTMPHKKPAVALMDEVSREARLMGAINTIAVRDERLHGFNTDGPGFAAAVLEEFGVPLKDLRVLILGGAGGAGRAITVQCALEQCPLITVANRNREKGDALAERIGTSAGTKILSRSLAPEDAEDLKECASSVDLIINATPLGMKSHDPSPLPDGILNSNHLVYDTVYTGGTTSLLVQAQAARSSSANGLSMLLHQGVLAYEIWFGERAPLETMRTALSPRKS